MGNRKKGTVTTTRGVEYTYWYDESPNKEPQHSRRQPIAEAWRRKHNRDRVPNDPTIYVFDRGYRVPQIFLAYSPDMVVVELKLYELHRTQENYPKIQWLRKKRTEDRVKARLTQTLPNQ